MSHFWMFAIHIFLLKALKVLQRRNLTLISYLLNSFDHEIFSNLASTDILFSHVYVVECFSNRLIPQNLQFSKNELRSNII